MEVGRRRRLAATRGLRPVHTYQSPAAAGGEIATNRIPWGCNYRWKSSFDRESRTSNHPLKRRLDPVLRRDQGVVSRRTTGASTHLRTTSPSAATSSKHISTERDSLQESSITTRLHLIISLNSKNTNLVFGLFPIGRRCGAFAGGGRTPKASERIGTHPVDDTPCSRPCSCSCSCSRHHRHHLPEPRRGDLCITAGGGRTPKESDRNPWTTPLPSPLEPRRGDIMMRLPLRGFSRWRGEKVLRGLVFGRRV